MHIIGNLVKQSIALGNQIKSGNEDPVELQASQLEKLLEKAKNTAFGKYYDFEGILKSDQPLKEFRQRIPIHQYGDMHFWWKQAIDYPDITWPGKPDYFAKTSGTTGNKPKRIPVSDSMIDSIRQVGISQLISIDNFDLPNRFFEKQILMLGSSTELEEVNGHQEGEISGISAGNLPSWFDMVYKPGQEISSISDWDERVSRIARKAPEWDIGAISGIPSWILLMLKEVVKVNGLKSIHDIWPDLMVYTSGGVAFEPYRPAFEKLFSKEVHIMDTYLASEGFFAYNARPETDAMQLALEHGLFFEFIPFDERGFDDQGNLKENPEVLHIGQVEEEKDYALIISTCAGNWRYMIGDLVQFKDTVRKEIIVSGRTKYFLNVVGSQLSEEKMNKAIAAFLKIRK